MKVLADSLNSMPDAPVELYQEFMEDITKEIERETSIINDLLSLVKMDKSAADLNISAVNINELLESIMKRLQPIADKQKVELVLESFRPVTAEVDEVKLSLAFTNLIENAIKYNKNDGELVYAGFLIKFSIDSKKIEPRYLAYYCQSKNYWNQVKSLFTGSTRNNVNAEQYAELKIPMCDAKLQHHIVNTISFLLPIFL